MLRIPALLLFWALAAAALESHAREPEKRESSMNAQAARMIAEALKRAQDRPDVEKLEIYQSVAEGVVQKCPNNVIIAEQLLAATSGAEFEKALRSANSLLTFKMKEEAELPEGFPQPTPAGEIQVKSYPAYRLARTASQNDSAFFTLFAHITLNRIAMTAPVEMTYSTPETDKQPQQTDMAFLYSEPTLGKLGNKLGGVKVEDIPAMMTVSIGLKGDSYLKKLSSVERRLEDWLSKHGTEYERAGNLRVLGYNSPGVQSESRYYEVELPIRKR